MSEKPSVLFVCLGNICRSPLAEAAFRQEAARVGLDVLVDSAGTGNWHVGEAPDRRAQAVAKRHGVDIAGYRGRQLEQEDFRRFTHIVALDLQNFTVLQARTPADSTAKVSLLLDHVEGRRGEAVADPYYGDESGFEVTWRDVAEASRALTQQMLNDTGQRGRR
jgi:protein-tyrosine phosphatase